MNLVDAFVSLDGNDISAFLESVDLDFQKETDADARMGDDTAKVVATRSNWSLALNAINDYTATTGLDDIIWGLISAGAAVPMVVRPTSAAKGANNPEYTGDVVLTNYKPIAGQHGQQSRTPIQCQPAGDLSRATS